MFKLERGERPGLLEGHFKMVEKRAEHARLTISPKFQGWLQLTLCRLSRWTTAVVLSRAMGNWELDRIARSLR